MTLLAIGLALLSAVSLAYGALLQHRGVSGVATEPGPLRLRTILRLLGSPYWVAGLLTLGAGVVANVIALSLAPVMVVQPVGAFSLVISILLGVLHRGLSIDRSIVAAVAVCVVGVTGFVTVSALVATSSPTSGREAHVLALLALACTAVALVGILSFHVGIGVLMGLPWFSLTMIAVDAIFIRDETWKRMGTAIASTWRSTGSQHPDGHSSQRRVPLPL